MLIEPIIRYIWPFVGKSHFTRGFTLIELLITLVIAGILTAIAVPSMQNFVESNRLSTAANDLLADINLARTEAIKRQGGFTAGATGRLVMCASSNGTDCSAAPTTWNSGWIVFWDQDNSATFSEASNDVMLKTHTALSPKIAINTTPVNTRSVAYNQLGMLASAANTSIQMTNTKINKSRSVCLSATGQAAVRASCP